jgi:hypothetical protein
LDRSHDGDVIAATVFRKAVHTEIIGSIDAKSV